MLPVTAVQLETGTILVEAESEVRARGVALYGRVSSSEQKADLQRQQARLVEFATKRKLSVTRAVTEVGSGLNGTRTKLLQLLRDLAIGTIVVEHRERLARFGMEFLEAALSHQGEKWWR